MKLLGSAAGVSALVVGSLGTAHAGGLLLPGSGAVSTSRAGASVSSVTGGDSIAINPAGLASTTGTQITVSAALIDYDVSFRRAGVYEDVPNQDLPYEGQAYGEVRDDSTPPIGIGDFQAVPVIAIASDLGGKIRGLTVGAGIWAPNAYPTRSISEDYVIDSPGVPPPPSRYDVVEQEAAILLPSVAVAYRVLPNLDFGARFSWGIAHVKAQVYLWGFQNYSEWVGNESIFGVDAKDNFVPSFSLGARYRPLPNLELGAVWSSQKNIHAKGKGTATPSADLNLGGTPITILPVPDEIAQCGPGGTSMTDLKACVDFALPMIAKLGGRWIFRDQTGAERGDVELEINWEHWSDSAVQDYKVLVDGEALGILLKESLIRHNWQDAFSFRLGGSYSFAVGPGALIARGGVAYDTKAAPDGWERLDIDGAARLTMATGVGYRLKRWQIDVGGGFVYEGSRYNGSDPPCNPTVEAPSCSGADDPVDLEDRTGPDPVTPTLEPGRQFESPFNQGTYKSRYVLLALGVSTWF
jgi:long-subunit fatty acid transport protein